MSLPTWERINDLTVLFTARPVAVPLIILLAAKIYSLAPSSLLYMLALVFMTGLFAMRWSLHMIAQHKVAFAKENQQQNQRRSMDK